MSKYTNLIDGMELAEIPAEQILKAIKHMEASKKPKKVKPRMFAAKSRSPFNILWGSLPQIQRTRSNKSTCEELFQEALKDLTYDDMNRAVNLWINSPDAKKKDGKPAGYFIPSFERWMQGRKYESWLEVAKPMPAPIEMVKLDPDNNRSHLFLTHARRDNVSESDVRYWLGKFTVEVLSGVLICVVPRGMGDFGNVFRETIRQGKCSVWPQSTWDREMEKQA